ncbi:MAG: hypothetical protein AMS26_01060 [Bacteroides sp. SM23_62]|nr:MAG: hypothetical protein AMS26_01060 [Bacteroides sp. SM23_62]
MIRNYLKITFRKFYKYKSYSLINIFGLSLGILCSILIFSYIGYELSYDGYHKNADNIYRIVSRRTSMGKTVELALAPAPIGPTMIKDFPEVVDAVRFSPTVRRAFRYKDKKFFETGVLYADQSVFNVFSFDLIEGDPKTALEVPFTMVLTEKTAHKYFGNESAVGKVIKWDNKHDYQITGVVKDPPPNSHFTFNVLASFSTFIKYDPRIGSWRGGSFQTYLLLQKNTRYEEFEQKMTDFNKTYLGPILKEMGVELQTFLQPLKSIHLLSHLEYELSTNSDIRIIYVLVAIAIAILLIACINFINLATAFSSSRSREIGLRKVLGAERKKLVFQFYSEAFVFTIISSIIAIAMAWLILPYFNILANREISITHFQIPYLVVSFLAIVLFVGFFAGSYPAFYLSALSPVSGLRGNDQKGSQNALLRSILVIFQFSVSIILIISTIIIFKQQKFMRDKDLGFNTHNLLVIALQNDNVRFGLESFKNELLNIKGVVSAGASTMVPGEIYLFNVDVYPEGFSGGQGFRMQNFYIDHDFLNTFEIEITQGRGFLKEITTDATDAVMINETAAKKLEWDQPIGKNIEIPSPFSTEIYKKTVIGVFRDIHQRTLYSVVEPTFIEYVRTEGAIENRARRLTIRLNGNDISKTMKTIEHKWYDMFPDHPYYSFFLDEYFASLHQTEERLGSIFRTFAILAVIIGCLGLFGLASFITERRTKEIGIRKVMGSTVGSIVFLLCKKFIFLIIIANIIAWPAAFYIVKKWLQNFPYAVSIDVGTFIFTAILTMFFTLLTVGYRIVKAARKNPVVSLRYE